MRNLLGKTVTIRLGAVLITGLVVYDGNMSSVGVTITDAPNADFIGAYRSWRRDLVRVV